MARGAIGVETRLTDTSKRVTDAQKKGSIKSLRHAGASIRKTAIGSMARAKGPSAPGQPPHRHKGRLARSILFAVEKEEVVVGPSYKAMKFGGLPPWVGAIHEHGGTFGGKAKTKRGKARKPSTYPARPYMRPALESVKDRLNQDWRASMS